MKTQCDIDLYLDVDEGTLKWQCTDGGKEVVMRGIGKGIDEENHEGWVPHFIFGCGKNQKVRVAQIPIQWYGQQVEFHLDWD